MWIAFLVLELHYPKLMWGTTEHFDVLCDVNP